MYQSCRDSVEDWPIDRRIAHLPMAGCGEHGRSAESLVDYAVLENTLTDFIRDNTFIACVVICCNNKRVGRSDLQSRSNIVGGIPDDCENRRTICAGTDFSVHLIACQIAFCVGIPSQAGRRSRRCVHGQCHTDYLRCRTTRSNGNCTGVRSGC